MTFVTAGLLFLAAFLADIDVSEANQCPSVSGRPTEIVIRELREQMNDLQRQIDCLTDKKGSQAKPGQSCRDIKDSGELASGTYWIRPAGSREIFQGYCDMSAVGQWKKVRRAEIDSTLTGGVDLTYSEENNGLTISVRVVSNGCGKDPQSGALTFIKGYWTKIRYTQQFKGMAPCWSIFGDEWYGRSEVNHVASGLHSFDTSQGDTITNQYYMGGRTHAFDGKNRRCDNDLAKNFWRDPSRSSRHGTVTLRRDLSAEKAGIFTGTSCGKPTYKIKNIYVYY